MNRRVVSDYKHDIQSGITIRASYIDLKRRGCYLNREAGHITSEFTDRTYDMNFQKGCAV